MAPQIGITHQLKSVSAIQRHLSLSTRFRFVFIRFLPSHPKEKLHPMHDDTSSRQMRGTSVNRIAESWLTATEFAFDNVLAANRAALTAAGLSPDSKEQREGTESVVYSEPEWTIERSISEAGTVSVGDSVRFGKQISENDIEWFAAASGDTNRLHLDSAFASETMFGGQIAHGTLVSGLISAALARFPGVTVYLSQDLTFLQPVAIGDHVMAECAVIEDLGDNRFRLSTKVFGEEDQQVIDGEAVILIDTSMSEDD